MKNSEYIGVFIKKQSLFGENISTRDLVTLFERYKKVTTQHKMGVCNRCMQFNHFSGLEPCNGYIGKIDKAYYRYCDSAITRWVDTEITRDEIDIILSCVVEHGYLSALRSLY